MGGSNKHPMLFRVLAVLVLFLAIGLSMPGGFTADDKQAILDEHNRLRRMVAKGTVPGQPAGTIEEMEWDPVAAQVAQNYINGCPDNHNNRAGQQYVTLGGAHGTGLGENLAGRFSSNVASLENINSVLLSVNDWFDEVTNPGYTFGSGFSGGTGHYTQVVWSESRYLGCGYKMCPGNWIRICCNYAVPGNSGPKPYEDGAAPCLNCPDPEGWCNDGLCHASDYSYIPGANLSLPSGCILDTVDSSVGFEVVFEFDMDYALLNCSSLRSNFRAFWNTGGTDSTIFMTSVVQGSIIATFRIVDSANGASRWAEISKGFAANDPMDPVILNLAAAGLPPVLSATRTGGGNIGPVVGGVVGGLILVAVIIVLILLIRSRGGISLPSLSQPKSSPTGPVGSPNTTTAAHSPSPAVAPYAAPAHRSAPTAPSPTPNASFQVTPKPVPLPPSRPTQQQHRAVPQPPVKRSAPKRPLPPPAAKQLPRPPAQAVRPPVKFAPRPPVNKRPSPPRPAAKAKQPQRAPKNVAPRPPNKIKRKVKLKLKAKMPPVSPRRALPKAPAKGKHAAYNYDASSAREVSLTKGEAITIVTVAAEWTCVRKSDGTEGFVPSNYLN